MATVVAVVAMRVAIGMRTSNSSPRSARLGVMADDDLLPPSLPPLDTLGLAATACAPQRGAAHRELAAEALGLLGTAKLLRKLPPKLPPRWNLGVHRAWIAAEYIGEWLEALALSESRASTALSTSK